MPITAISPTELMYQAPGVLSLQQAWPTAAPIQTFTGPFPSAITGLSGWWDAGILANILDSTGTPIPDWTGTNLIGALQDKSSGARNMSPSISGAIAISHLSGLLGGVGKYDTQLDDHQPPIWNPVLDSSLLWSIPTVPMGSSQAWTRYIVWSRPNFRQNWWQASAADDIDLTNPVVLLKQGSTVILQVDPGNTGNLTLLPGPSQTVLSSSMTRRHTHSIIIRNTPGVGIDVWLDATQVATAVTNPLPTASTATLDLLGDPSAAWTSAQCYFHEAAMWEHALVSGDITTLLSAATRWLRGPRKGANILINGQSNAGNFTTGNAPSLLQQAIRYYLGVLSCTVCYGPPDGDATIASGTGLYSPQGDFLHDPGDGSSPSTWSLGGNMSGAIAWAASLQSYDLADFAGILWFWNENDSQWGYSEKARYTLALKRFVALERALFGQTAASMPLMFWAPIPYASDDQMIREVFADVVADPTQNASVVIPMTSDSNANGASAGTPTGTWTGGDTAHRDQTDLVAFALRGGLGAARALLASGRADDITLIPTSLPQVGGPHITVAHKVSSTNILVTVVHDQGTDLLLPGLASTGIGLWEIMDGGSVASPGTLVSVTNVARVDPTHLSLTLSQALTQSTGTLFYPWDSDAYSLRGDAVTDNYASISKPAAWDIGADLGSIYTMNFPLQATGYGIALT
jgi:hypothetical protein